jgi:hypothetical protein
MLHEQTGGDCYVQEYKRSFPCGVWSTWPSHHSCAQTGRNANNFLSVALSVAIRIGERSRALIIMLKEVQCGTIDERDP